MSTTHFAHRGLIIRDWRAKLNGIDHSTGTPPFTFSLMGSGWGEKSLALEIGLNTNVFSDTIQVGDFVEADVELFLFPTRPEVHYGASARLSAWLTGTGQDGGTLSDAGWKIAQYEAERGDLMAVAVGAGTLERRFPPRIRVDESTGEVEFSLVLASDWPGVLPIVVCGRSDCPLYKGEEINSGIVPLPDRPTERVDRPTPRS